MRVSETNALPGWNAYQGSLALANIYYVSNFFSGSSSSVELEGGSLALSGNFSVGLFPDGSISQTGQVPANAESLQFETDTSLGLEVTLGGQNLSYSMLSAASRYDVFGANIPAGMDGQTEALTFTQLGAGGDELLDNIEFSPTGVPEPSEYVLFGLGTILFGVYHRRKRRRDVEAVKRCRRGELPQRTKVT